MDVGTPRPNLLKPKAPQAFSPVIAVPIAVPIPPMLEVAPAPTAPGELVRDARDTKADSVEVTIEGVRGKAMDEGVPASASTTATAIPFSALVPVPEPSSGRASYAPSPDELLERAHALGPIRTTWESIVLPADPILDEKQTPHVAERRARLTRIVKITLAACLGVCVLALFVSALSGDSSSSSGAPAAVSKTIPATSIVPVEHMDGAKRGKARHFTPTVTTAAITTATIVRPKRR